MRQLFTGLAVALTLFSTGTLWSSASAAATNDTHTPRNAREQVLESLFQDIDQATFIAEGKGPHVIYVFFDPNCPYCHKLYLDTRDWIKEGKTELRWIPVGILTATSADKAAAMLDAKDPLQAFYDNEDHYTREAGKGGGLEGGIATPAVEKQLQVNEKLLARTGMGAVPAMLFRATDNTPILIQGSPPKDKLAIILQNLK